MATQAQSAANIDQYEPILRSLGGDVNNLGNDIDSLQRQTNQVLADVLKTLRNSQRYLNRQIVSPQDEAFVQNVEQEEPEQLVEQQTTPEPSEEPTTQFQPQPQPQQQPETRIQRARAGLREFRNVFAESEDHTLREEYKNREQRLSIALQKGNWTAFLFDEEVSAGSERRRKERQNLKDAWSIIKQVPKEAAKGAAMVAATPAVLGYRGARWTGRKIDENLTGRVSMQDRKDGKQAKLAYNRQIRARVVLTRRAAKKKKDGIQNALQDLVVQGIVKGFRRRITELIQQVTETGKQAYRTTRIAMRRRIINSQIVKNAINSETARNVTASLKQAQESQTYRTLSTRTNQVINTADDAVRVTGRNMVRVTNQGRARLVKFAGRAGRGTVGVAKNTAAVTKRGLQFTNNVRKGTVKIVGEVAKRVPSVTRGVARGSLAGGATFVALGASSPTALVAAAAVSLGTAAVTYNASMRTYLDTKNLRTEIGDWDTQAFKNGRVTAEQQSRIVRQKNIYRASTRAFRALDAGLTYASIGALAGTLLGGNALIGATAGFAIGAGSRYLIDRYIGRGVAGMLEGKAGFLAKLARIPTQAYMNQTLSNQWLIEEIHKVNNEYGGDIGRYFRENWTFAGASGLGGNINVVTNYVGAAATISASNSFVNTVFAKQLVTNGVWESWGAGTQGVGRALTRIGLGPANFNGGFWSNAGKAAMQIVKSPIRSLISAPVGLVTNPITMGMVVGTVLGAGIGGLLGFTGPGAVLGAAIGSTVGAAIGGGIAAYITLQTGGIAAPLAFAIVTTTTTVFSVFGSWIGNFFDNSVGNVVDGLMGRFVGLLNSIMAVINLLKLMMRGITPENALAAAMGLITLMTLFNNSTQQGGENKGIEDISANSSLVTPIENIGIIYLEHYNIALLDTPEESWTPERVRLLMQSLQDNSEELTQKYSENQLILAIGREEVLYESDSVVVYIEPEAFNLGYRPEYVLGITETLNNIN